MLVVAATVSAALAVDDVDSVADQAVFKLDLDNGANGNDTPSSCCCRDKERWGGDGGAKDDAHEMHNDVRKAVWIRLDIDSEERDAFMAGFGLIGY